jgi:ubiquinone/menaquinone biosynthesis C-methylase UbiE
MNIYQILIRVIITLLAVPLVWLFLAKIVRRLIHFPAPAFIGYYLDSDIRRQMQPPGQIIERSGFKEGDSVLEIGCGSGAYTTFVARAVGEKGSVAALDIQPAMLAQLQRKLEKEENLNIRNITLHQSDAYDLPFDPETFDVVYMITVLPEIPDQQRTLQEILRVLKPGGILALSEFFPDPDYPFKLETIKRGKQAGFDVEGVYGNLWTYTVRFRKKWVVLDVTSRQNQ